VTGLRVRLVAAVGATFIAAAAIAVESDPLPLPAGGPREKAVSLYNDGVKLMLEKRFGDAQRRFEEALALDEGIAEAHNNLAFSLRMQGIENFKRAMRHYDRAIEINPKLAQAYVYRGVLLSQVGDSDRAQADLRTLRGLDAELAQRLAQYIAGSMGREERDGIAPQFEVAY
jgi:tetratricopeptide (TPR) repeat protein